MKKSYYILGICLCGMLLFLSSLNRTLAYGENDDEDGEDKILPEEEDPKDGDGDGIDDDYEEENVRYVEIWFGDNVVEIASIKKSDYKKDIMDLRIAYKEYGISLAVSFRTMIKVNDTDSDEVIEYEDENEPEKGISYVYCDEEWIYELKLQFEVKFQTLIEYVDLNDNGVFDYENDTCIEGYGINSFHPIIYEPINISDETVLHYFLLNTTDGVFATHIYFPEEFVLVNGILVAPTQIKIDIEITNYDYIDENSQLALYTKLFSEDLYEEQEETEDEKNGLADEEKEVFIDNEEYRGIFSWKETAMIDGVEMPVLTNQLEVESEEENKWKLFFNYPRGNHIYHDPKIGIVLEQITASEFPMILVGPIAGVAGLAIIATGILISRRKVR